MSSKSKIVCSDSLFIGEGVLGYGEKGFISCGRVYKGPKNVVSYNSILEFKLEGKGIESSEEAYLYLNIKSLNKMGQGDITIDILPVVNVENIKIINWDKYFIGGLTGGIKHTLSKESEGKYVGINISSIIDDIKNLRSLVLLIKIERSNGSALINFDSAKSSKAPILLLKHSEEEDEEYTNNISVDAFEESLSTEFYSFNKSPKKEKKEASSNYNTALVNLSKDILELNKRLDTNTMLVNGISEKLEVVLREVDALGKTGDTAKLERVLTNLNGNIEKLVMLLRNVTIEKI